MTERYQIRASWALFPIKFAQHLRHILILKAFVNLAPEWFLKQGITLGGKTTTFPNCRRFFYVMHVSHRHQWNGANIMAGKSSRKVSSKEHSLFDSPRVCNQEEGVH